ncbi:MAG: aromatic amino acid ammonia-lyase [Thermoleophilia bacterium]|nr:aromatic amino acid ammonia-lyase [Thermoleophilia bacterium]
MIELGADGLDRTAYLRVVHGGEAPAVPDDVLAAVDRGREAMLSAIASGLPAYGVTTGLGHLASVSVRPEDQEALQRSLLTGRASGLGPPLPTAVTRGAMLLRLSSFLSGRVGVGAALCRLLATLLAAGWEPVVPAGPYGAAGEIGPSAHLFQTLIGEGTVVLGGTELPARDALGRLGLEPFQVGAKEGLALVNGSPFATALGIEHTTRLRGLVETATTAATLQLAVTGAGAQALSPEVAAWQRDDTVNALARSVAAMLEGSASLADGAQPPVSARVALQVHAAAIDAIDVLDATLDRRLRAVTDSPLVLEGDETGSVAIAPSGGFHAVAVSLGLETLAIAATHVLNLVEKRLHRLHDARFSGLPEQLAAEPGAQSGTVALHKAVVGLAADARSLAAPASVHALDTSAGQEDVQAFTFLAAERAGRIADNLESALACELVALRQAAWLRGGAPPGPLAPTLARLEEAVPPVAFDRTLSPDVERVRCAVADGLFRTPPA